MAGAPSGNDNAAKNKPFWSMIDRAIKQDDGKRLRAIAEKLLDEAAAGKPWAVREVADRLDGKSHQSVAIGNPDGTAIFTAITRTVVDPAP